MPEVDARTELLYRAVQECCSSNSEAGSISVQSSGLLVAAIESLLKDGLKGNRATPAVPWSVVCSMARAYPLLLGPAVDTASSLLGQGQADAAAETLLLLWVLQAAADGTLGLLIDKVRSQPQVFTAYNRTALIRCKQHTASVQELLMPLKGATFEQLQHASPPAVPASPSPTLAEPLHAQAESEATDAAPTTQPPGPRDPPQTSPATRDAHSQALAPTLQSIHTPHTQQPSEPLKVQLIITSDNGQPPVHVKFNLLPESNTAEVGHTQGVPGQGGIATSIKGLVWATWAKAANASNAALASAPHLPSYIMPASSVDSRTAGNSSEADPPQTHTPSQQPEAVAPSVPSQVKGASDTASPKKAPDTASLQSASLSATAFGAAVTVTLNVLDDGHVSLQLTALTDPLDTAHEASEASAQSSNSQTEYRLASWMRQLSSRGHQQPSIPQLAQQANATPALTAKESASAVVEQQQERVPAEQEQLQVGVELGDQICGVAQGVLEMAMLRHDPVMPSPLVQLLLKLLQGLLAHGLRSPAQKGAHPWASMLAARQSSAFSLLQAVEARGASMGLEGLEQHAGSAHDNARVRTWLRKSLNEQALGARLLALSHDAILLEDWFESWALLRQEGMNGRVLGMLASLDGIRFLLPVDPFHDGLDPSQQPGMLAMPQKAGQLLTSVTSALSRYPAAFPTVRGILSTSAPKQADQEVGRSRITGRTADIQDLHPHAASSTPRLPAIATAGIMDSLAGSTHSSLLSPLASEDLSAQPLSPATLAFFQAIELELDEMQVLPSSKQVDLAASDQPQAAAQLHSSSNASRTKLIAPSPLSKPALPDFDAHDSHAAFLQELLNPASTHQQSASPAPSQSQEGAISATYSNTHDTTAPIQIPDAVDNPLPRIASTPSEAALASAQPSPPQSISTAASESHDLADQAHDRHVSSAESAPSPVPETPAPTSTAAETIPMGRSVDPLSAVLSSQGDSNQSAQPRGLDHVSKGWDGASDDVSMGISSAEIGSRQGSADLDEFLLQDMHDVLQASPALEYSRLRFHKRTPSQVSEAGSSSGPSLVVTVVGDQVGQHGTGNNSFTEYVLEVSGPDGQAWQVAHRFRDFVTLRATLKAVQGARLPESWVNLSRARSVTGQSRLTPEVVSARRGMLQRCLKDIVAAPHVLSSHPALLQFLGAPVPESSGIATDRAELPLSQQAVANAPAALSMGGRVRLITQRQQLRSDAELMALQQGLCAGCQAEFPADAPSWRAWGFRSGAPNKCVRRCHFHGLLYCLDCHHGETAEVPACVLHEWDFTRYPICDVAIDFLQSIYDQPLLCVNAVNPGLYARIPLLARARELRQRACKGLHAAAASSQGNAVQVEKLMAKASGRRYLLESAEFWAMREMVELSKGAFSSLPSWLSAIVQHASDLTTSSLLAQHS